MSDRTAAQKPVTQLSRNNYGGGSIERTLRVIIDGVEQRERLQVKVEERHYTEEEMEEVFERAEGKLEKLMLGENESPEQIKSDLNLVTEIPEESVEVSWELDRYDLMNIYGEINQENLRKETESILVHLKAYLTYTEDDSIGILKEMAVELIPPALSGKKTDVAVVQQAVSEEEESSREEKEVQLPEEVNGSRVQLQALPDIRGWYVLLLGPFVCVMLVCLQKQNRQKEKAEKEHQMMLDYPEIMNKLTLLLGAGMTVKNAWQKIVSDYERQKESRGQRHAYEEMSVAYREMQSGVVETEAYERFGKRCGLKAYRKLASLLTQNLRKGTKGLTELLGAEAMQAFDERKSMAKKKGEEAGTKLLVPMFLMLAMVLVIVIVPAFLSIQM